MEAVTIKRIITEAELAKELREQYIKNPPEGMTHKLVKDMTDSDWLEIHYFLIEDDDRNNDELEEGPYINLFSSPSIFHVLLQQIH